MKVVECRERIYYNTVYCIYYIQYTGCFTKLGHCSNIYSSRICQPIPTNLALNERTHMLQQVDMIFYLITEEMGR